MATKARQQYFADEVSLSKEKREFSIADEIQQKIDSIEPGAQVNKIETVKVNGTALVPDANKAVNIDVPEVIDNLYTVDSDNALSAKQGKLLYDYIQNIASRGRFLSNWNSATGLPMTNPSESPYLYKSGDYFIVSNVAGLGGTNYRPDGSSYIIGQASTVAETEDVSVSDFYFYDGTNWLLLSNSGRQIAIDTSLSTTSTNPVENRVVTNALNGKQETLIAGSNIQIAADGKTISATDTTYSAGTGISIDANNVISSTVSPGATYTAGSGIDITSNVISADTSVVATQTDLAGKQDVLTAGTNIQIDTTTNTISATDTTYNAGKGIEIGDVLINGRQGPSPDGFHVPSEDDLRGLKTAMDSIFSAAGIMNTGNNWRINLHLPFAGIRYYTNGTATSQSTTGCYASSTPDIVQGYDITVCQLLLKSSSVNINILNSQSQGFSIRAFKDTFETPTSSWTVILGTLGSGGIFWNQTDGLISVTSNGTTGYTIMDKNLGATVVYSDGDTLSEANCGYYYQRGNDYGFPRTGSVTTSSTQVDASNYGPSNHYSSSTFITGNVWDSSQNGDLWGDITGTYTQENAITNTGVTSVNGQTGDITIQTGGNYSAGTGINISNQNVISADTTVVATQTDLANKQGTLTASTGINIDANNQISNTLPGPTIAATAPTGTEGALWYDTTNDVLMAYNGTAWKEAGTQMKILSYGHSTWQDFLNAYNENAVVYCRASSNSNPGTGNQGRMAFMAYININSSTGNPQEVEFQYYRSRSDHNSAANQLDEVYVYKLTGSGIWSVTQRDTAAKPIAGTGIGLTYNSSGMTISADTSVLATKTYVDEHDTVVSSTAPSSPTEGMVWYDTTNHILKVYDGTNWVEPGDNNVKVFTTTNSVVIDGGDFKNDTTLVNTIVDINNWMTSSPSHIAYLYYVDGNHMYYKCPVIWCKSSSSTKHIAYLISTGTSPKFDHFHRAYVNLFMSGGTATVGEIVLSEAPTYTAGENITIDQNNEISATDTTYTAGEGIAIGTMHSDMQGPAPDGFHVPSKDEWADLYGVLTSTFSMASNATTMGTYLKMPMAGSRDAYDSSVADVGSYGEYWFSTPSGADFAYYLYFSPSNISFMGDFAHAFGYSVRCFKDTPVIPTSSWTTLYQGSGSAGVFYNATDGFISVSGDGQTWYTIQDKNLGATTVFNQGDTLTDANCGYFFQWGNNYGFAHSGNVTTSSTQVDASGYGPGNYYNSSTFITRTSNPWGWSSVRNDNLWGGVSQGTWISDEGNSIINTGVLSVNGQTGNVTVEEPIEYTAGNGISIGNLSISSRQGPCEEGFHVPSAADWQGVETIMNGLGFSDGADWDTKLHLPKAGYRRYSDGEKVVGYSGATGVYWSTSRDSDTYSYKVFTLAFDSSNVGTRESECRAIAASIRPFKNAYVAPDATWTVIYGTLGSAGIFWNQTEGLISITDGTNGYTMADKNLGATTVYSSGNTLSEANCGYLYQWGNNYAFPWSGSVTTSSTLVNASSYGPGNYYSSSTFITVSSNPRDWSSVQNNDLWGDTTNTTTNINNAISNTGVLSVNGQTGAVTINEGDVKVFEVPAVNDDISDMVARLSAGKGVILHEMVSGTDAFYKVDYHDDVTQEITASLLYSYNGGYARYYTIVYNYSTKKVSTKTPSLTYFFAPETAGTQGQVLKKTNSGYEWANASGGFELAPNSPLTPKYRRYGSQAQYDALTQYYTEVAGDTVYFTI